MSECEVNVPAEALFGDRIGASSGEIVPGLCLSLDSSERSERVQRERRNALYCVGPADLCESHEDTGA